MGRGYRKKEPPVRPVVKAELSERHFSLRLILAIAFGLLAAGMIVYGIYSLLNNVEPGWQQIQAKTSEGTTCAGEFSFYYNIGASGIAASAEYRQLVNIYTEATRHAYRVFDTQMAYAELGNLRTLNRSVGETVAVDPLLYDALVTCDENIRYLFLAPVYAELESLCASGDDWEAYAFDAASNPEEAAYVAKIAAFAADPNAISLTLSDNTYVTLTISDEYAAFAAEYGIDTFVDFGYMKNAFVVDYLADTIIEAGYTRGILSSYDGYTRNLDTSAEEYTVPLYRLSENQVLPLCEMHYSGQMASVYLRAYPLNGMDTLHYYTTESGEIRTSYAALTDGQTRTATDTVLGYARTLSCAEILMKLLPYYIADTWQPDAVTTLDPALHVLYTADTCVYYSGDVTIAQLYDADTYTAVKY